MSEDEIIDEIIADLAAGLIDASDEEIEAALEEYDLSDEDKADILETIRQVREADNVAGDNLDPLNLDSVDAMADAHAQQMADEDNTEVTMSEEDADGDGDTDSVGIKKTGADPEKLKALRELVNGADDEGNSDEEDDEPHDSVLSDARMKNIVGTLSAFKY